MIRSLTIGFGLPPPTPFLPKQFNSIEEFFLAYNEDPLNKKLGIDIKQLIKDLALDGDGNLKYKPYVAVPFFHALVR